MADTETSPAGLVTMKRPYADRRVRESLSRILRENALCSMSTVAPRGRAHINTAYFCFSSNLEFYFLSDPSSLHCRNLQANSTMAMAIFRSDQPWTQPGRGAQLFGRCSLSRGRKAREAAELYGQRFRAYWRHLRERTEEDREIAKRLRAYRFYRFVPRSVKILDEAEFGGGVFVVTLLPRGRG